MFKLKTIKEIRDGIILTEDGFAVSLIECNGINPLGLSKKKFTDFLNQYKEIYKSTDFPIGLYVVSKKQDTKEYLKQLDSIGDNWKEEWSKTPWQKDLLKEYVEFIESLSQTTPLFEKSFFISICLEVGEESLDVVRLELEKRVNLVKSLMSSIGLRTIYLPTEECLDVITGDFRIGKSEDLDNLYSDISLQEIITPKKAEVLDSCILINESFARTYEFDSEQISDGWFEKIVCMDDLYTAVIHINSNDVELGQRSLITIQNDSDNFDHIENKMKIVCSYSIARDQMQGFLSTRVSLGGTHISKTVPVTDLTFPFIQYSFNDGHGILYGVNRKSSSFERFDRWSYGVDRGNSMVFGEKGAGKTYFTKTEIFRMQTLRPTQTIIIDLFGRYESLCHGIVEKSTASLIDMSKSENMKSFFSKFSGITVYSFGNITAPEEKTRKLNLLLKEMVREVLSGVDVFGFVVVNSISAAFSDEETLQHLAELLNIRSGKTGSFVKYSIISEDFSYFSNSVLGKEILTLCNLNFIFRQSNVTETKKMAEYYNIMNTEIMREQGVGEYIASINFDNIYHIKNIVSYTEDARITAVPDESVSSN